MERSHLLLELPTAELHEAPPAGGAACKPLLLAHGAFALRDVERAAGAPSAVVASVGGIEWEVRADAAVLREGEFTFAFAAPRPGEACAYVLLLASTTDVAAVGILEAVLESVTPLYAEASKALLEDAGAQAAELAAAEAVAAAAPRLPARFAAGAARGLELGAAGAASGILASAGWTAGAIDAAGARLRAGAPTARPVQLSDGFRRRLARTARLARWTARRAHGLAGALAWAGGKLAGAAQWALGLDKPLAPGAAPSAARDTAAAAAAGAGAVWEALEDAGRLVLASAKDASTGVAAHHYGPDAAAAAREGFGAATAALDAATALGPRRVLREAARRTARDALRRMTPAK